MLCHSVDQFSGGRDCGRAGALPLAGRTDMARPSIVPSALEGAVGRREQTGFSLLEMSVVLLLGGLLLGAILQLLPLQQSLVMQEATRSELQRVQQALHGFAVSSGGRLPCPDVRAPLDGLEDFDVRAGRCSDGESEGWLPFVTLGGVGRADAWGYRLRYRVQSELAASPAPPFPVPAMQLCRDISAGGRCEQVQASQVIAVIVSHGANGHGAILAEGEAPAAEAAQSAHERANSDGDNTFVVHEPRLQGGEGGEYDDLLSWVGLSSYHAALLAR